MRRFVLFARCRWLLPQVANGLALAFPDDGAPTMVAQSATLELMVRDVRFIHAGMTNSHPGDTPSILVVIEAVVKTKGDKTLKDCKGELLVQSPGRGHLSDETFQVGSSEGEQLRSFRIRTHQRDWDTYEKEREGSRFRILCDGVITSWQPVQLPNDE